MKIYVGGCVEERFEAWVDGGSKVCPQRHHAVVAVGSERGLLGWVVEGGVGLGVSCDNNTSVLFKNFGET